MRGLDGILGPCIAACLIGLSCSAAADTDLLQQLTEEPAGWASFDWAQPARLAARNESGWVATLLDSDQTGEISLERTLQASGGSWRARWSPQEIPRLVLKREPGGEGCLAMVERLGRTLGAPRLVEDRSQQAWANHTAESVQKTWQWTIGQTRIEAYCLRESRRRPGQTIEQAVERPIELSIDSAARIPVLESPFLLRCTRQFVSAPRASKGRLNDFVVRVTPGLRGSVKLRSSEFVARARIDANEVAFTVDGRYPNHWPDIQYRINRVTGELAAEPLRDDRGDGRVHGACQVVDAASKAAAAAGHPGAPR